MGRRSRRRWSALVAWVAPLALVVAPAVAATGTAQGVARGDDPLPPELRAWIDDHGPLRVTALTTGEPNTIVVDGRVVGGWFVELMELAALKLAIDVEWVVVDEVAKSPAAVRDGRADLTLGHAARPDLVDFAEPTPTPFAWVSVRFLVNDQLDDVLSEDDFDGLTATTVPGGPLKGLIDEQFPQLTYVPTDTPAAGLQAVVDGDIDLYLGPIPVIGYQLQQIQGGLRPVGDPVTTAEVAPWGRAGSEAVQIAEIGRQLITEAELQLIHVRWTGFDMSDPSVRTAPTWVVPALLATLAAAIALGGFAFVLRRRVHAATAELRELNADLEQRVVSRTTDLAMALADVEARNDEVVRFARDVAHDLRGPAIALGGLVGYLDDPEQPPEVRAQIGARIRDTTARLSRLVGERLDETVSRRTLPAPTGAELADWLAAVIDPEAHMLGASLQLDLPDELITAPVSALRRAVLNLVGNALKHGHGPDGPTITVTLRRDDDEWVLVVADRGPGVPPELRDHVFDEGVRGDPESDTAAAGLGLGLAATRRVVEAAGGSIELGDSHQGAVFVVRLPVLVPEPAAAAGAGGPAD